MEVKQAMKILHPDTTLQALAEVEYLAGFNQGAKREAWDEACDEACITVCDEIEKLQAENASLRELLRLAVADIKPPADCYNSCTQKFALQALQEKSERENPQPLTIEQLRQMDGEPVWITSCDEGYYANGIWTLVKFSNGFDELVFSAHGTVRYFSDYGKTWLAYKYKPKED